MKCRWIQKERNPSAMRSQVTIQVTLTIQERLNIRKNFALKVRPFLKGQLKLSLSLDFYGTYDFLYLIRNVFKFVPC